MAVPLDHVAILDALHDMLSSVGRSRAVSRDAAIAAAADVLQAAGFDGVRYYQLVAGPSTSSAASPRLYLAWQSTPSGTKGYAPIGYEIRLEKSSYGQHQQDEDSYPRPVCGSSRDPSRALISGAGAWVKDLALTGKSWVDIPIVAQGGSPHGAAGPYPLAGLLCADWLGPASELDARVERVLSVLGQVLGAALSAAASPVLSSLRTRVEAAATKTEDPGPLMQGALECLHEELQTATSSLFLFSWSEQCLRKTFMFTSRGDTPEFAESFRVGERLTGKAWRLDEYRAVYDFEELCEVEPSLKATPSYGYHSKVHRRVQSVVYAQVATRNPRYLIRLINHRNHPDLPLFAEEALLQELVADLSPLVDARIASRRTAVIREVLELIASGCELNSVLDAALAALLDQEGVKRSAIIAHREGEEQPHVIYPNLRKSSQAARRGLLADPTYRMVVSADNDVHVHVLARDSLLASLLPPIDGEDSGRTLVSVAFKSGSTQGALLIPVLSGTREEVSDSLSRDTRDFLMQLASACGQAIETNFVRGQTSGALRALSLIGHELVTPLAIMTNTVESALLRVRDTTLDAVAPAILPRTVFDDAQRQIAEQRDVMNAAIHLGALIGRQGDGQMIGQRRELAVGELINRALWQVREEIERAHVMAPQGLTFRRPSGRPGTLLSCDYGLVVTALVNLYRNAAKYSSRDLTRPLVQTRVQELTAGGHSYAELFVTNFGLGIPRFQEDLIFEPFVRAGGDEPTIARRGMGLGLYLVRQVARAHHGTVELAEHAPAGAKELAALGGGSASGRSNPDSECVYRTTFRLRLRLGLPRGPYRVTLPRTSGGRA